MEKEKIIDIRKCNYCGCYFYAENGMFISYKDCCRKPKCRELSNTLFRKVLEDSFKALAMSCIIIDLIEKVKEEREK